jgi:hypothetical protein
MESLKKAYEKNESTNIHKITWDEVLNNKDLHGIVLRDKWGFYWKYKNEELKYRAKEERVWNEGNVNGADFTFKKFSLTEQGIKKIKLKIESLTKRVEKIRETKRKQEERNTEKYRRIGHGAAMRGYKCMKINWDKPAETQKKIDLVLKEIETLKSFL